ncbi:GNAT family N-acetyltransferase [Bacillus sp. V3-13]|uniref:GNAT family N-acetyltransferase n=1 Tax=Bacillus sp. V3-13 TaxID=2053728 RepID=UPI000C77C4C5|nr:GNAT family N-acetyltransferase [Bacillus sp. V3-13]PLR78385.1 GNAT family N-acetyltransferase [Bacillus sp. V3-13]
MNIRVGTAADIERIMEFVIHTVEIMNQEGNDQWSDIYPHKEDFLADCKAGSLYVAEKNGTVTGSITIDQEEPPEYEQANWRSDQDFFVFHRLVVDPDVRGAGIASQLISFSESYALEKGVFYLKTDTYSLNKKAQLLFEKNGFVKVGTMEFLEKEHPFYCYDKFLSRTK